MFSANQSILISPRFLVESQFQWQKNFTFKLPPPEVTFDRETSDRWINHLIFEEVYACIFWRVNLKGQLKLMINFGKCNSPKSTPYKFTLVLLGLLLALILWTCLVFCLSSNSPARRWKRGTWFCQRAKIQTNLIWLSSSIKHLRMMTQKNKKLVTQKLKIKQVWDDIT